VLVPCVYFTAETIKTKLFAKRHDKTVELAAEVE
jgi:hypothetical protein